MNEALYLKFIFIFLLMICSNNYIILPFKTTNFPFHEPRNNMSNIENFLSQINNNQLYTSISLGNPAKNIDFYLSMEQLGFSVLTNNCKKGSNSSYSPNLSNTFKNITPHNYSMGLISKACLSTDKFSFYNNIDLSKNISLNDLKFLLGNNSMPSNEYIDYDKFCGIIGNMRDSYNQFLKDNNFIYYLKRNKIINSYTFGIYYFDKDNSFKIGKEILSKYDGFYIAGISNDSYSEIFKTDKIENSYAFSSLYWSLSFNKIYFNDSEVEYDCGNNTSVDFLIDMNYITSTRAYYENIKKYFFKIFLEDQTCVEEETYSVYEENIYMIICNSNFKKKISSFPKIYFFNDRFPFIFNLDYNDVFIEYNNKIYFLIVFKKAINTIWRMGKIFLKKYPLIFDYDQNKISFVHLNKFGGLPLEDKKSNKKTSNYKIYIVIFLLILAIILGVYIGKYIWIKKRKIRANELDDNYEYEEKFKINE